MEPTKTRQLTPSLPLPPEIKGSEVGSFAHFTICVRLPEIAQRVIAENDFPPAIVENLQTLIQEIPNGLVRHLKDTEAPDLAAWESYIQPYIGMNWLDIPWYFAEAYFYRRILEAIHYFPSGESQAVDPYEYQKRLGLSTTMAAIQALSTFVKNSINSQTQEDIEAKKAAFIKLLYFDLWGNRVDLSLWPVMEGESSRAESERENSYILVDDTAIVADRVANFEKARIDFIVDNAGFELVGDLCLADFLLATNAADKVYLHLKAHPIFVSDAMTKDVRYTVEFLGQSIDSNVKASAERLKNYIDNDRLVCQENLFWTSPLAFWEMPDSLYDELAQSSLILVKGDANYRRTLGDRHWPYTISYQDVTSYFPGTFLALRTLKSELAAGLKPEQIERVSGQDAEWLTDGQWGVIQFVEPS